MNRFKLFCCVLLALSPFAYLAAVYSSLPASVPTHFDLRGNANDYSRKETLWLICTLISGISIGCFLLFNNLQYLDPKRKGLRASEGFARLADGVLLFLTTLNFIGLAACSGHAVAATKLIFPMVGMLFAFVGNVMFSLKPNFFAGIRVPWTLADNDNWRATHRLAGRLWFCGGLLLLLGGSFAVAPDFQEVLMFVVLVPMVLVPVGYSYWLYRRKSGAAS